jgi:hypothetical protein
VAAQLLHQDREALSRALQHAGQDTWRDPIPVEDGVLGHFCDSLHDLAAHILMWDEIADATLVWAMDGRAHWSLEAAWETPAAGSQLNRAGVAAGRQLDGALLLARLHAQSQALERRILMLAERWDEPFRGGTFRGTFGELAHDVTSPPDGPAFGHVARHLGAASIPASVVQTESRASAAAEV